MLLGIEDKLNARMKVSLLSNTTSLFIGTLNDPFVVPAYKKTIKGPEL